MSFALAELLAGAAGKRPPDLDVKGINADSRAIAPGEVFFALPGTQVHGNGFVGEAVLRGAVAVVSDRAPDEDPGVPVVVVDDVIETGATLEAITRALEADGATVVPLARETVAVSLGRIVGYRRLDNLMG